MTTKKQKKKMKLKVKNLVLILVILLIVIAAFFYLMNIKIKNIYITGTTNIEDIDIIEAANISSYPSIYKLNLRKIKKSINEIPLVEDVKIKRNIFGKITFEITEYKILFYYKYNNKYITSKGVELDYNENYLGYPTLINFTPDTIFNNLVTGLDKIDYNILFLINEIEYAPYKSEDGTTIDNNRFTLTMNDSNTVYIDTPNIKNLNQYPTIIASPGMSDTKGEIYLDTMSDDRILFKSYDTIKKEQEDKEKKEKEAETKTKKENDN